MPVCMKYLPLNVKQHSVDQYINQLIKRSINNQAKGYLLFQLLIVPDIILSCVYEDSRVRKIIIKFCVQALFTLPILSHSYKYIGFPFLQLKLQFHT